ncbi:MAG TPA: 3-dehydroquinate synthase [Candidatus Dormibacteraeota bacterium]|nr:3-dehydroquinate synthase [Candidatus Dormibacteraeota bacterium]
MVRLILDSSAGGYPVLIGSDLQRELRSVVARLDPTGAAIVTDTNVRPWAVKVAKAIRRAGLKTAIHAVPAGERSKSMLQLQAVLDFLERQRIDRGGIVIAVGGGTVGDLAGFAASVWQRGVRLVAVPTTLLAMVDSSIGGKTGVNGRRSKNAIGTFWQPSAVISDLAAIETLPEPAYRDAFAEVVKYAVAMDRGLFDLLQRNSPRLVERDPSMLQRVVFRCVAAKALVVAKDERERGPRAILNYGHTAGHALEVATGYRVSHGRAVAFGMRVAARIALAMDLCSKRLVDSQDALLEAFGLPDRSPRADARRVMSAITLDKKARRGKVAWVMPRRVGHAEIGHAVPGALVRRVISRSLA